MPTLPRTTDNLQLTANRKQSAICQFVKCQMSDVRCGFSLIELMVVVALFGVAASLVTASYLNFERNHRVKSAASTLKNELRLIQNKVSSGDKGPADACSETSTLGGWYLKIQSGVTQTSYSIGGVCVAPVTFTETTFERRTITLPRDLIINKFSYDTTDNQTLPVAIFFRPLTSGVSYINAASALPNETAPDFFDDKGIFFANKVINPPPSSTVKIELADATLSRKYQVAIESTGEVNEIKP